MDNVDQWTVYVRATAYTFDSAFSTATPPDVNNGQPEMGKNLFKIEDILQAAGTSYHEVRTNGAMILGQLLYDCNLDQSTTECNPQIQWTRLDIAGAGGFNYRYVDRSVGIQSGKTVRTLYKAWGIRVMFTVSGNGRRASPTPLFTAIGAGIGLLAVSSVICDIILQYFMPNKDRYKEEKFQAVNEGDFGVAPIPHEDIASIASMANSQYNYTDLGAEDPKLTKNPAHRNSESLNSQTTGLGPDAVKLSKW
jgi:hypothetical protein